MEKVKFIHTTNALVNSDQNLEIIVNIDKIKNPLSQLVNIIFHMKRFLTLLGYDQKDVLSVFLESYGIHNAIHIDEKGNNNPVDIQTIMDSLNWEDKDELDEDD